MLIILGVVAFLVVGGSLLLGRDRRDAQERWHDATAAADRWGRYDGPSPPSAALWCRVIETDDAEATPRPDTPSAHAA